METAGWKRISFTIILAGLALWAGITLFRLALADAYASFGKARFEAEDYEGAGKYYRKGIGLNASEPAYYQAYARSLLAAAKADNDPDVIPTLLEEAKQDFQRAIDLNPLEGNPWLDMAQTCWWLSRFKGREQEIKNVEPHLIQALSLDPANGKFLYGVVNYYLLSGRIAESLPYVKRLAAAFPYAYHYLKDNPRWFVVKDRFKQGLKASTNSILVGNQALGMLASLAAQEEDWAQAADYTRELIRSLGALVSASPFIHLGGYYLKLEKHEEARKAFIRGLRLAEDPLELLQGLLRRFRNESALDLYVQVVQETAGFDSKVQANLSLLLGQAYLAAGDIEAARWSLDRSLKERPTAEAYAILAGIALKEKDWNAAELESHRAIVLEPENPDHYHLLATSMLRQEKYKPGLEAIDKAIKYAGPSRAELYNTKGWLYWESNDLLQAVKAWKRAAYLGPKNAGYPRQVGMAYKRLKDYSAAERYFLAALELKPSDQELQKELAEIRRRKSPGGSEVSPNN